MARQLALMALGIASGENIKAGEMKKHRGNSSEKKKRKSGVAA
jgi:uncharacterized protein YoaH (UPF0181 family)